MDTNVTIQAGNTFSLSPDWFMVGATIILVFATWIYVYFAYRLTQETVKLREIETTPLMSIHIEPSLPLKIIIKNIGKAPAYNIKFKIDEKYKPLFTCGCSFGHQISYFSPDQQLVFPIKTFEEVENLGFENIPLAIQYQAKDGRYFQDSFSLEWKYLSGTIQNEEGISNIENAIKDIGEELKSLNITIKAYKG